MSIDERLQFLLQSTESLHSTVGELTGTVGELSGSVRELTQTVAKHEKRWELVRRVMIAALQAGIEPENGEAEV